MQIQIKYKFKRKIKQKCAETQIQRCLETLLLDEATITFPSPNIVGQGTEAIMRFLCQGELVDVVVQS